MAKKADHAGASRFTKLFGKELVAQGGKRVSVQDALITPGKPVALYFSAHWCPPCRGFTPQLAKWYSAGLKDKLEVVFVSSDKDQGAFDGYFGEQPWLALPFEDRKAKAALSKRFKVQGIPTLVVLDGEGKLVTTKGRARVSADNGADADPLSWKDPTLADVMYGKDGGAELLTKGGAKVNAKAHLAGKVVGIYFSAHWCGPCRGFTPSLCATYNKLAAAGKTASEFEIVFASSDRSQSAFDEYYGEMPFAAIPFADRARKEALSEIFGVRGIPTLVFVDAATGKTITTEGRAAIAADPDGKDFPWRPKPLNPLESGGGALNEKVCVIALCEGAGDDAAAAITAAMEAVAVETLAPKAGGGGGDSDDEDESDFAFFHATAPGRLSGIIRDRLGVGSVADKPVALLILDTGDNGAYYTSDVASAAALDAAAVRAFVAAYGEKTLTRQQMS